MTPAVAPADLTGLLDQAVEIADVCARTAAASDVEGGFPSEAFEHIRASALLTAPLAPGLGGHGLDGSPETNSALLRLLAHLGRGNLSAGRLYEGHVNALQLIQTFGRPDQIASWAADVRERRFLFGVWNTEARDGVRMIPLEDGRYRLEGSKSFASGAGQVERPIVTGALPDSGWQMAVVPMEQVSVSIDPSWWKPLGMRASASYKVDLTGVILDRDDLLGVPGDYYRQPWFGGGAARFAAVQLGGAEGLLDATRAFLAKLGRIEDPHQRARLGRMAIAVESGRHWLESAARLVDLGPDAAPDDIERVLAYANMTRLAVETICLEVLQLAERSVGARGLLQPEPIERVIRDLTHYLRQPTPDAALDQVGKTVLDAPEPGYRLWLVHPTS